MVVAIDGPAGSGKSTVSSILAERIGAVHADSGAIYRTITLALIMELGAGNSHQEFGERLDGKPDLDPISLGVSIELLDGKQSNQIRGLDVAKSIRTPEVTQRIRYIADRPHYRESVNQLLRSFSTKTALVVDGRDIGSVVFPDATYKFFLDASPEVRARRRILEMREKGYGDQDYEKVLAEIRTRDDEDYNRPLGALKRSENSISIDTSELSQNDVLTRILGYMQIQF